jgi:16S rRNA (guanine(966)-N(2))-methyltransferase RsmD
LTRPTSGKARQALFNILADKIPGSRFLDLCAGSGSVGLEALSRGAEQVVVVEKADKAFTCLRQNCQMLSDDQGSAKPIHQEAFEYCEEEAALNRRYDLIFVDPPFSQNFSKWPEGVLPLLAEGGMAIVQFPTRNPPVWVGPSVEVRAYGESSFAFLTGEEPG